MTKVTSAYASAYAESEGVVLFIADCTPPRSGDSSFVNRVQVMDVEFVCVAYNPGKLVRADPVVTAYNIKERLGRDVVFNIATRDMNKIALGSSLLGAHMLGLENVIVVQGDDFTVTESDRVSAVNDFTATGLLRSVRDMNEGLDYRGLPLRIPTDLCLGATLDTGRNLHKEALLTLRKVQSGAEYFITQPIYSISDRKRFLDEYERITVGPVHFPVFWGIQVLHKDGIFLGQVSEEAMTDLEKGRPGTDIAVELIQALKDVGVHGIYIIPPILRGGVRDYDAAQRVVETFR
jgi:5,10-methylenetetrahydrofolate reductase